MSIEQFIDSEVKSNDVVLFMKGTPQFPQCGFSGQVVQILDHVGVGYKGLNVLESSDLRDGALSRGSGSGVELDDQDDAAAENVVTAIRLPSAPDPVPTLLRR